MTKVFIDGSAGTTGLRIAERLAGREDLTLLRLPEEMRKDPAARRESMAQADVVFLCLPDAAAEEAVTLISSDRTVVIDTSTAHRTAPGWVYGFPEIGDLGKKLRGAKRVANPGCHASGFISLIAPLTEHGLLPADTLLTCFSLTGYSGGGKKMIADYRDPARAEALEAPRAYGLGQTHKHLPEMKAVCGLSSAPVFTPIVSSYYAGMTVTVPLFASQLRIPVGELPDFYRGYYRGRVVTYDGTDDGDGFLSAASLSGTDGMKIGVYGSGERITLVSRFDNLGKGASGAAIQNMNIILGLDETSGLTL